MRPARLLPLALLALTVAACASRQPAYYVTDARTGQRISTGQQAAPQNQRGLMSSGGSAQASAYRSYAYAAPQSQASSGRGLFNSDIFGTSSPAPTYTYQPQAQPPQSYSYRPPQQQPPAQQSQILQYRPPQPAPQAYARQTYAPQPYRPPQPQPAGYYAARYGWY